MTKKIFILLILLGFNKISSQENFTLYTEPEIKLGYKVSERYTHSFAIENRTKLYENNLWNYDTQHIDLSHFSKFKIKPNKSLAIGLQYRFRKDFDNSKEDEFRLTEQYEWKKQYKTFSIHNRLRNEQRFYNAFTTYRLRYNFGIKYKVSSNQKYNLKTEIETLAEFGNSQKPEFEQRLTELLSWTMSPTTSLEIGVQYRLTDYTQDLGHELFLLLGLDINL